MTRRLPSLRPKPRAVLFLCLLVFAGFLNLAYATKEYHAVLVASKDTVIPQLQPNDIRRIFLGLPPVNSTLITTPILNVSNNETYALFLKNIMFLTERGYKRKLIKRVFRQGADKIDAFHSMEKLTSHLRNNPNHITYMLSNEAVKYSDLKVIQVLW